MALKQNSIFFKSILMGCHFIPYNQSHRFEETDIGLGGLAHYYPRPSVPPPAVPPPLPRTGKLKKFTPASDPIQEFIIL